MDLFRKEIINCALAVNRYLSQEWLAFMDIEVILCFCHPIDREYFARKFRDFNSGRNLEVMPYSKAHTFVIVDSERDGGLVTA
jgi:hypothetical protein